MSPPAAVVMPGARQTFLVTGGAGFIGSALVRHLIAATGHAVVVLDKLTYAGNRASLSPVADDPRLTFVQGDIADAGLVGDILRTARPNVVVHLAAETHVDRSIDAPAPFIATNVVGTSILLDAVLDHWRRLPPSDRTSFRFHQVSTDEVFGDLGAEGRFDEAAPYRPRSPYAASKASADHLVAAWHATYGLPVVLSNCGNNYGPCQFPEKFIPLMILNALEGKPMPVYGDGSHVRDWLHVGDHARALVAIAERGGVGERYNVGADGEKTNLQVVEAICALVDASGAAPGPARDLVTFVADRPGHDRRYAIDAGRLRRELGWRPRETFQSGLAATVRWYLDNRAWWEPLRRNVYEGDRLGLLRAEPVRP